jgi:hypothetical protein
MRVRIATLLTATLISLSSCIHAGLPSPPSPSTTCPFGFEGAREGIESTAAGADIRIIAYGDVTELRQRARDAAAMYGPGAHRGLGHHGQHNSGLHHGLGLAELGGKVTATEEDTNEGALIHISAVDPATVEGLRTELSARAARARVGECPST